MAAKTLLEKLVKFVTLTKKQTSTKVLVVDANNEVYFREEIGGFFANDQDAEGAFASKAALDTATPADESLVRGRYAYIYDGNVVREKYDRISGEWVKSPASTDYDEALKRENHTGEQTISTVTNLQTTLDDKIAKSANIKSVIKLDQTAFDAEGPGREATRLTFIPKQ